MKTIILTTVFVFVGAKFFDHDGDESIPTKNLTAVAGYKAGLPCDIDPPSSDEVVMVLWYREETIRQPIFSVDARRGGSVLEATLWSDPNVFGNRATIRSNVKPAELEINPLIQTDHGVYRCRVDFRDSPTRNYNINLTVIVPPQKPVILANEGIPFVKPLNEGSELSLRCEVVGGVPPPRVAWYLESKLLDDTHQRKRPDITVNHLDVKQVSREFLRARLICRASNTHLVSPVSSEIILDVNLKPVEVNIANKQNHLSALQTYEVECSTSGSRPSAVITWWKGTHQVKHMARNFAEEPDITRSVLSYVATIEDDGKFLTCRAENPSVPDSALEDTWALVVHYVPVVTIKFGSNLQPNKIIEGDDIYFECDVKANPAAYKLGWLKNGKELHQNVSGGIYLPGGQSLVLRRVTRSSAGEYSCMAVNVEGTGISRPATLEVMYTPICKDGSMAQVVGALKHETISLVCGVQAKPPPTTFHWTFNNSGELTNVSPNHFAEIKPPKLAKNWHGSRFNYTPNDDMDYGTVSCWARNIIGIQKSPCLFQIIVAGKPYPLQNCSALQSTGSYTYKMGHEEFKTSDSQDADWLIVRCVEGFDGGLPLTGFELELYTEESIHHIDKFHVNHSEKSNTPGHQGPVFGVPGLEPGRNYKLLLYAVNAKGRSDPVVLEPVSLKGVAMYTTGRGSSVKETDYSLLVACFTGGVIAVCILVVGITLTIYRRTRPIEPIKTQTHHVVNCGNKEDRRNVTLAMPAKDVRRDSSREIGKQQVVSMPSVRDVVTDPNRGQQQLQLQQRHLQLQLDQEEQPFQMQLHLQMQTCVGETNEENPDVVPNRIDRRTVIFEPNYNPKTERTKTELEYHQKNQTDYEYPSTVLHRKDNAWIYPNGYSDRPDETSPVRPSTLPVHRTHDIYTRSSRIQESCI